MLNQNILDILKELERDIPDFYMCHGDIQQQIAFWIAEDRLATEKRIRRNERSKQLRKYKKASLNWR